jgi:hypothetical protein
MGHVDKTWADTKDRRETVNETYIQVEHHAACFFVVYVGWTSRVPPF